VTGLPVEWRINKEIMMKKFLGFVAVIGLALGLVGCHSKHKNAILTIGAMSGPESQLVKVAQQVAKEKYNLPTKLITFDSYNIPNAALAEGSIDVNVFQHLPFLKSQIAARGYPIMPAGKTFVFPMALYSKHLTTLSNLQNGARVAIPNDPSNEGRALLLLQKAGLITLKKGVGFDATPQDIAKNPKQLKIITLAAAQLPRSLQDVSLAAINTNYAKLVGLSPQKDGLFEESEKSPYANLIVIRKDEKNDPRIKTFVRAMQSPEVKAEAKKLFGDGAIAAF
jgi:D-methionine transport system substrate-binding protein